MDTITSVLLAAASGIGFFAYNCPKGFDRLFTILYFLSAAGSFAMFLWNICASIVFIRLTTLIGEKHIAEGRTILASIQIHSLPFILTGFFLFYLLFLQCLPMLVKQEVIDKKAEKGDL